MIFSIYSFYWNTLLYVVVYCQVIFYHMDMPKFVNPITWWQWFLFFYFYFCCCSVAKPCLTMVWSMSGISIPHHLPEFAQFHDQWISDTIQPSHPLSPSSYYYFNGQPHEISIFYFLILSLEIYYIYIFIYLFIYLYES